MMWFNTLQSVYGIPEDCIRKATDNEELMFRMNFAIKNAKSYGNKIDQIFFDEFVTKDEKENNTMRFEDETIVKISGHPGFKSRDIWGIIKRYYGDGKYGVYSLSKSMENYGVFDEKYLTAYEEVMHDPERVLIQPGSLAVLTNVKCGPLCKIVSVSFEPNSRPEYELEDIDSGCEFHNKIYKEDFILVKPIKRNYKDEILTPTPAYFARNYIRPEKVIFSGNRTVVIWSDGDKTIVKANCEVFDREKGLAMAVAKKVLGTNPSKSNYYDVFKKWIPEEEKKSEPKKPHEDHGLKASSGRYPWGKEPLNEEETEIMEQELEKLNKESEEEGTPWDPSMRHQSFKKKTREQISEEIVDKIMAGADTEDIKKSIEESKKIIEHEKVKAAAPKVTSYKPSEPSDMGVISDFVKTFKPTYFFKDFLEFCKNNGLAFITNDGEVMNPFEVSLPKLNWLGKQKRISTVTKHKVYPGTNNQGKDVMAVDVNETLFQRLPREFRTKGQKEN